MYDVHPIAAAFPPLSGEEFEALRKSIATQGLLEAITLLDGKILDGANRYRACVAEGVEPRFTEYDGEDPAGFVAARNLRRRHLNQTQLALLAESLLPYYGPAPLPAFADQVQPPPPPTQMTDQVARDLGVSGEYVRIANRARREVPDLIPRMERGEVSLKTARLVMALPGGRDRDEVVRQLASGEIDTIPTKRERRATNFLPVPEDHQEASFEPSGGATAHDVATPLFGERVTEALSQSDPQRALNLAISRALNLTDYPVDAYYRNLPQAERESLVRQVARAVECLSRVGEAMENSTRSIVEVVK